MISIIGSDGCLKHLLSTVYSVMPSLLLQQACRKQVSVGPVVRTWDVEVAIIVQSTAAIGVKCNLRMK